METSIDKESIPPESLVIALNSLSTICRKKNENVDLIATGEFAIFYQKVKQALANYAQSNDFIEIKVLSKELSQLKASDAERSAVQKIGYFVYWWILTPIVFILLFIDPLAGIFFISVWLLSRGVSYL